MWLPFAGPLQNDEELVADFKAESLCVVRASTDRQGNSREGGLSIPQIFSKQLPYAKHHARHCRGKSSLETK